MTLEVRLITLEEGKRHLHIDDEITAHDLDVQQKIAEASSIVLDYLKLSAPPADWLEATDDSPPGTGTPNVVKSAVYLVLGELFLKREGGDANLISEGIERLLMRRRDPTLA